jgi:hypothetical protein
MSLGGEMTVEQILPWVLLLSIVAFAAWWIFRPSVRPRKTDFRVITASAVLVLMTGGFIFWQSGFREFVKPGSQRPSDSIKGSGPCLSSEENSFKTLPQGLVIPLNGGDYLHLVKQSESFLEVSKYFLEVSKYNSASDLVFSKKLRALNMYLSTASMTIKDGYLFFFRKTHIGKPIFELSRIDLSSGAVINKEVEFPDSIGIVKAVRAGGDNRVVFVASAAPSHSLNSSDGACEWVFKSENILSAISLDSGEIWVQKSFMNPAPHEPIPCSQMGQAWQNFKEFGAIEYSPKTDRLTVHSVSLGWLSIAGQRFVRLYSQEHSAASGENVSEPKKLVDLKVSPFEDNENSYSMTGTKFKTRLDGPGFDFQLLSAKSQHEFQAPVAYNWGSGSTHTISHFQIYRVRIADVSSGSSSQFELPVSILRVTYQPDVIQVADQVAVAHQPETGASYLCETHLSEPNIARYADNSADPDNPVLQREVLVHKVVGGEIVKTQRIEQLRGNRDSVCASIDIKTPSASCGVGLAVTGFTKDLQTGDYKSFYLRMPKF